MDSESTNIQLKSNIMLKTKYDLDPWKYIPADMLPAYYCDIRAYQFMSPIQKEQQAKRQLYAQILIDDE